VLLRRGCQRCGRLLLDVAAVGIAAAQGLQQWGLLCGGAGQLTVWRSRPGRRCLIRAAQSLYKRLP